ncbi:MAG TPA: PPOX class F420-dependent oxidoreductase [Gaiellaceae bacterium]|jgi:PPOX class probable F420-dependent enzyme
MAKLTDAERAFIRENQFCGVVTTLRKDGSPHSTVVWVDEKDGKVVFNTAYPRAKSRELERDPRATVVVMDRNDDYRWISVSGPVSLTTDGANEVINRLSNKYDGTDFKGFRDSETRVTALVTPEKVDSRGID